MASFTQGSALPNITTTQTKTSTAPGYYTDYLTDLSGAGTAAMNRPADQLVAGYDPLQTQGYGALSTAATAYQPGLANATQTANLAAQGMSPELISQYMNPYTQNVVNEMARQSQIALQKNLPTLKAGFVGSGGLGSQRYAGALGQSLADVQSNLTTAQTGALQRGYENALDAAYKQSGLYRDAATQQAALAAREQELGLASSKAMTAAGAERQAYEQAKLDAPLKVASEASKLLQQYQVPINTTQTDVGPKTKDYYGTSTLGDITGILATIGAVNTNSDLYKAASSGLGSLLKYLKIAPTSGTSAADAFYNYYTGQKGGWTPFDYEKGDPNFDGTMTGDENYDFSSIL
jgi:hypothetical protein